MRPCLRSSPTPGRRAAGRRRPRLPSTLRGRRRARRPLPTPSTRPAPRPHPPPFPRSPAVTQVRVGREGGCRAGATARSACWRPPAGRRRTITTPTGPGGPGRWRTSTPSTETAAAAFSHVSLWGSSISRFGLLKSNQHSESERLGHSALIAVLWPLPALIF